MAILLAFLGGVRAGLAKIGELILKYPLPAAAIGLAIACAVLTKQKNDAIHDRDVAREQLAQATGSYRDAQVKARNEAIVERAAVEQRYADTAKAANDAYTSQLTDARARVAAYLRSHPVVVPSCPAVASAAGEAVATGDDHHPAVSPDVPGDAVVVSATDVQACTDAVTYALKAHEWALSLRESP